jgi:hypothetical protein
VCPRALREAMLNNGEIAPCIGTLAIPATQEAETKNLEFKPSSTKVTRRYIKNKIKRMNIVEILCTHISKRKNETC